MPQFPELTRRDFLTSLSAGAASLAIVSATASAGITGGPQVQTTSDCHSRFRRRYAPHLGMFRHLAGDGPIDQIRFMADEGFAALEDNGFMHRPFREQEKIAAELDRWNMRMGLFIASADFGNPTFASGRKELRRRVLSDVKRAAETAQRTQASGFVVVPGRRDVRLSDADQRANAIELLKQCAEFCELSRSQMFLEPLNHWGRHPQMFLHSVSQGAELCRAVGSDSCRLLFDVYHQAVTEPDVFEQVERHWDAIGYFQIGDNPGRKEPGTGNFDFRRLFRITDAHGYDGLFGMEHGNANPGPDGERAVIEAYRRVERA